MNIKKLKTDNPQTIMPLVTDFICDICKTRPADPHFKIGEQYGEPLHAHKECIPILLSSVQGILFNSTIKKEFNFTDGSMISKESCVPPMIDLVEEMNKPEIIEKSMVIKQRMPVFIQKLQVTFEYIEENINLICSLATWDCLYE